MDLNNSFRRIVIVGNGYDLAHGLHTSYYDFAQKYSENS